MEVCAAFTFTLLAPEKSHSSLVGFALLVILSPAPGHVGKLIARYGKERMVKVCLSIKSLALSQSVSYRLDGQTCTSRN